MSTGGSVVEFSPATRKVRVRFPARANFLHATILISRVEIDFGFNSDWPWTIKWRRAVFVSQSPSVASG